MAVRGLLRCFFMPLYSLSIQLKLDVGILDSYKVQYDDPGDQFGEIIRAWLTTSEIPTWGAVVETLDVLMANVLTLWNYTIERCDNTQGLNQ